MILELLKNIKIQQQRQQHIVFCPIFQNHN